MGGFGGQREGGRGNKKFWVRADGGSGLSSDHEWVGSQDRKSPVDGWEVLDGTTACLARWPQFNPWLCT